MPEYHVGCGLAGIYAGTLKKNGNENTHYDTKDRILHGCKNIVKPGLILQPSYRTAHLTHAEHENGKSHHDIPDVPASLILTE